MLGSLGLSAATGAAFSDGASFSSLTAFAPPFSSVPSGKIGAFVKRCREVLPLTIHSNLPLGFVSLAGDGGVNSRYSFDSKETKSLSTKSGVLV